MAGRPAATDPLHAFRFHASMIDGEPVNLVFSRDVLQPASAGTAGTIPGQGSQAGFQSITAPELTQEVAEYREGIRTYTQKFPGVPSVNDITMIRGAARFDTAFIGWILAAAEGDEYRGDMTIYHIQRPKRSLAITDGAGGTVNMAGSEIEVSNENTKRYILRDSFPTRVKISGDLDSSTSDVSLSEVDVAYERFDVQLPTAA